MKRILKSIIAFDGGLTPEQCEANFRKLGDAGLRWLQPADERIHRFICDFRRREPSSPSYRLLVDFFTRLDDIEVVERLKGIKEAPAYQGGEFSFILGGLVEDQRRNDLLQVLATSQSIATKGALLGDGKHKVRVEGVDAAVDHALTEIHALTVKNQKVRTDWDITTHEAVEKIRQMYDVGPASLGVVSGLLPLDEVVRGIKPGEMWVHAAYAGGLKTTFALNVALKAATQYRRNILYVSMEMTDEQLLRTVSVLHSSNRKFAPRTPLDIAKVKAKRLTTEERAFYEEVLTDLHENPDHCRLKIHCASSMKVSQIQILAEQMRRELAQGTDAAPLGLIVIDHSLILEPEKYERDPTEKLTKVIRACKALAQDHAHGKGVPVMLLHQINREGQKRVSKEGLRYTLADLSRASEAERSADVVTTTRQDDVMRGASTAEFDMLKHREGALLPPFMVDVCPHSRWIAFNGTLEEDEMTQDPEDVIAGMS